MLKKLFRSFRDWASVPSALHRTTDEMSRLNRTTADQLKRLARMAANAERDRLLAEVRGHDPRRLELFGYQGFSQNDEDGIIAEIFRRIGTTNRTFVEFGAADGKENNSVFLLLQGWSGLWLEGCVEAQARQTQTFAWAIEKGALVSTQAFLTTDNINPLITAAGLVGPIDLLSIDVDGNDFHLWQAIDAVAPRVVVIEYNAYVAPPIKWVMPYSPTYVWDGRSTHFGASLAALAALGAAKGYALVGCNYLGLNAFFVRTELAQDGFCQVGDVAALYHPRRWWLDRVFDSGRIDLALPYAVA